MLNLKIKYRESFRPFAAAVLAERAGDYFELERESPYMLLVADVRPRHRMPRPCPPSPTFDLAARVAEVRSTIPAVTHVDYSARVQTVDPVRAPRFHRLIQAFEEVTGCPLVINTSFNVRGEPIVGTREDACSSTSRSSRSSRTTRRGGPSGRLTEEGPNLLFAKHVLLLLVELFHHGRLTNIWWPPALVLLLILIGAIASGVTFVTPYIYTLF
jgi:hypothetical protein